MPREGGTAVGKSNSPSRWDATVDEPERPHAGRTILLDIFRYSRARGASAEEQRRLRRGSKHRYFALTKSSSAVAPRRALRRAAAPAKCRLASRSDGTIKACPKPVHESWAGMQYPSRRFGKRYGARAPLRYTRDPHRQGPLGLLRHLPSTPTNDGAGCKWNLRGPFGQPGT